ncbi:hypothetical protein A8144_11320 [Mycobacterium leprae 3125609]|nr:hypothetical protein A8144_11320 [Mycobacterium leprae 3125609]OAX70654.1 hypothetical protein A3216_10645 [Mycobacterium leprae 7935681]
MQWRGRRLDGVKFAVRHWFAQHFDGNVGFGVALGVAVSVGGEQYLDFVVFDAGTDVQQRHLVDLFGGANAKLKAVIARCPPGFAGWWAVV